MKIRYLILVGILAYAVGLVVALPARTALAWAPPLPLQGVDGRVLDGQAASLRLTPEHSLHDLSWKLAPASLLRGRLGADVAFGYLDGRGSAQVAMDYRRDLRVDGARLRLAAAQLADRLAIPLVELDGELEARIESARFSQNRLVELAGRVIWRQAALSQPLQVGLGEIEAVISQDGDNVYVARLSNTGGSVSIDGELRLTGQRLQTDVRLRPLAGAPAELGQTLAQLARRQNDGSYRIQRVANLNSLM